MRRVDLIDCTGFEWDSGNGLKSHMKHGVSRAEAEEIFFSAPLVARDIGHSEAEARYHALGETVLGRRLLAVFTVRARQIRIISVRDMSRRERQAYEKARKAPLQTP